MNRAEDRLANLIAMLDVVPTGDHTFEGLSPKTPWQRLYGGQVIGQAMMAASKTVCKTASKTVTPGRAPHAMHLHFLRPGDPGLPVVYTVETLRDGRAFTVCLVRARQNDRDIATSTVSFHGQEPSAITHNGLPTTMPPLPKADAADFLDFAPLPIRRYWQDTSPLLMRPVNCTRYENGTAQPARQAFWLRLAAPIPKSAPPHIAACILAYASDMTLLDTALAPDGKTVFSDRFAAASLDHSVWLHRPVNLDDWVLYDQESPVAANARGFSRGQFITPSGEVMASAAQEGLIRPA